MPIPTNPSFPTLPGKMLPLRTLITSRMRQSAVAGTENVVMPWSYPRYRYTLSFDFLRQAAAYSEIQSILGFINKMCLGTTGTDVFMYDDPTDDTTVADQAFGVGDGVDTTFQLVRTVGGFAEPVFAVNAITNLKVAGVAKSSPADYSVDNKGVVTFVVAPANAAALTWTGTYLWFCRLDDDETEFEQMTAAADFQGPVWLQKKLSFTTIKFGS